MTSSKITIDSLHSTYRNGGSVIEVIESLFKRISTISDPGIFITLIEKDVIIAEAKALGNFDPVSKPLWGVPFAIKDNIDAASIPTTAGCPEFSYIPDADATVVARLREAGAILIGKTNLDEFAMGSSTERSAYQVTKNPWNLIKSPGGSSGGSAAAVAANFSSFSTGTDTGGSIRQPASFCGIAGIKPTYGRVSRYGMIAFASSLDQGGILAKNIKDTAIALQFILSLIHI